MCCRGQSGANRHSLDFVKFPILTLPENTYWVAKVAIISAVVDISKRNKANEKEPRLEQLDLSK